VPGVRLQRLALPSAFASAVGSQDYLRDAAGLSEGAVVGAVRSLLAARAREMSGWNGTSGS